MNTSVQKFLIAAFVALYLSCETSAATVGTEEFGAPKVEAETTAAAAAVVESKGNATTVEGVAPKVETETVTESVDAVFKCDGSVCPNGVYCEIRKIPSDDEKTITKTSICKDAHGHVLDEKTTTEDVPEGEIPFTSITKTVAKGGKNGFFYGSSRSAGLYGRGNLGSLFHGRIVDVDEDEENTTRFDIDADEERSFRSLLNDFMSTQRKTIQCISDRIRSAFGMQ